MPSLVPISPTPASNEEVIIGHFAARESRGFMGLALVMYKGRKDERRERVEAGGDSFSLSGAGAETKEIDMARLGKGREGKLPFLIHFFLSTRGRGG